VQKELKKVNKFLYRSGLRLLKVSDDFGTERIPNVSQIVFPEGYIPSLKEMTTKGRFGRTTSVEFERPAYFATASPRRIGKRLFGKVAIFSSSPEKVRPGRGVRYVAFARIVRRGIR